MESVLSTTMVCLNVLDVRNIIRELVLRILVEVFQV